MSSQERTIMGACDYSLATLQGIKKTLGDISHPNKEINWAIGGVIITLTSYLLKLCGEQFMSEEREPSSAKEDIKAIQAQFNEFIDRMLNND
jgi:hypothetical protein